MRRRDPAALLSLVAVFVLLYRQVVRLWWIFDDSQLLRTLYETKPVDAWTSAAVWPQQLFTPLMFSAFEAEHSLFGLDPFRWYVAHLGIASLSLVALYFALRRFVDVLPSFAAVLLFLLGTPMCSLVDQLSTVHYFIAILCGSLAALVFDRPLFSALFYFLALLAKEIAAPLPLLLFFLHRDRRAAMRGVVPHTIALMVYLAWRRAVIGAYVGAYSWATESFELPRVLAALPWKIVRAFAGQSLYVGLALVALMLVVVVIHRRAWRLFAIALIVAILPILPVAKSIHPRYAVIPWLALAIAFAASARRRELLLAACALAAVVNRAEWAHEYRERLQMSDEGRVFMDLPPGGLLRAPLTPPPVLRELYWLNVNVLQKPAGAGAFYDDLYLCTHDMRANRVWEYQRGKRAVVEIDPAPIARRHCASLDFTRPLSANFTMRDGILRWDLGPYDEGTYRALLGDGAEAWTLPRRDALNLRGLTRLDLRIRYDSPEGWTTYSPPLALEFRRGRFEWQR